MKPVVIFTGSSGFLGTNFIDYIRANPDHFTNYNLLFLYGKNKPDVEDIGVAVQCDLYNIDDVKSMFSKNCRDNRGVDRANSIIIHMASVVGGINFHIDHPADVYYKINMMDANLVEAARVFGIGNFMYAGSACGYPPECYDVHGYIGEHMFGTGEPEGTVIGYGSAKKEMLTRLKTYGKQYGMKSCYPILTNMFGLHDNFDEVTGHVIPALIGKFLRNPDSMTIRGSGRPIRDFLPASKSVRHLWCLATNKMSMDPCPINVGCGCGISIRDIVRIIIKHTGWSGELSYDTSQNDGTMKRILSIERLNFIIPFKRMHDESYLEMMDEEIGKTIEWYKNGQS